MSVKTSFGNRFKNLINNIGKDATTLNVGFLNSKEAEIAIKNEFGGEFPVEEEYRARAEAKGIILGDTIAIPPRPFMQQTFNKQNKKWRNLIQKSLKSQVSKGGKPDTKKTMQLLGEQAVSDIQDTILAGKFISNSMDTIIIKDDKDKPLIDSGEMLRSVNYEVI